MSGVLKVSSHVFSISMRSVGPSFLMLSYILWVHEVVITSLNLEYLTRSIDLGSVYILKVSLSLFGYSTLGCSCFHQRRDELYNGHISLWPSYKCPPWECMQKPLIIE